ncbi:MAG TPA: hypothetical protein VFG42_01925 [Baekduia sp.]|uniref:hypothetical protein n=1 Tax=Baekduia sp. TaxID=2600305 RepID=UPI002D770527|nr:hypothetical protein [Baekduia sp.]HET6505523.1 hypothetical protein [Baekduia sp.]
MPDAYLVLFVADAATDGHADALRAAARRVEGAGFFDDPDGGEIRTVGTYVRAREVVEGLALLREVAAISAALGVRFEVQHAEAILGLLVEGHPDASLARHLGDIPEPL